jgi:outer membrane biosynthesis protein TonB
VRSNQSHVQPRPPRHTAGALLLLFALAVGLIAVLPSSAPVALAARLFQSPVESPPAAPTAAPEQPTPIPEQPTLEPATPTEAPQAPVEQATPTPEPTTAPVEQAPAEQTPADAARPPEGVEEPEDGKVDWVRLIDTTVLVFSWFWLACGVVVVIAVAVFLIVVFRRSKRRQK